MFLQDSWSFIPFFTGYIVGIFVIFSLRRYFKKKFYLKIFYAIIKLLFIYIKELISSSILIIQQILRPKLNIEPGIFSFETKLKGDYEITLLALLINLTPGSVILEVSHDNKEFLVHTIDMPVSSKMVKQALKTFEIAIMEVTR